MLPLFLEFQFFIDFGPFWEGFGKGWGRFGQGLGRVWEGFGEGLGKVWGRFGKVLGMKFSSHWRNEGRPADCALRQNPPPHRGRACWTRRVKFFFYLLASKAFA